MGDNNDKSISNPADDKHEEDKPQISRQEEEKFAMLMRSIETGTYDNLTSEQIDKLIEQRGTVHGYIHDENMQSHERFKISQRNVLIILGAVIAFALLLIIIVAFVQKDQIMALIEKVLIFIGGMGFGKVITIPGDKKD